jgi:hypothetical protein
MTPEDWEESVVNTIQTWFAVQSGHWDPQLKVLQRSNANKCRKTLRRQARDDGRILRD